MAVRHLTGEAVSVRVDASPEAVYDLVSDVTRTGEWSPECYRCRWVGGATGPAVGARFRAWNRKGLLRWTNRPRVVAADRGREFAFSRVTRGAGEVVWRYRMEPDGAGTRLTESYEAVRRANPAAIWVILRLMRVSDREADLRQGMEQTLDRIKAIAESR